MLKQFEHGGNIYEFMRSDNNGKWLDFSANINPLGLSEKVYQAITAAMPNIIHYPDIAADELKNELEREYGLKKENIILGNGAVEILYILCNLKRPSRVLLAAPAFNEYERSARAVGAAVDYLYLTPENSFQMNSGLLEQYFSNQQIFFWGNPNNPTGTLLSYDTLEEMADFTMRRNCLFVIDQSFIDFRNDYKQYTAHQLIKKYSNVIVLHSLTKFYAIPGLRLGFASASDALIAEMELGKDQWNVNSLAQAAGVAALQDKEYQISSRRELAENLRDFCQRLQEIENIKVYTPTVNFVLVELTGRLTAAELRHKMAADHILIRDCSNYVGLTNKYVRFAVKTAAENEQLLQALQKHLKDDKK